MLFKKTALFVLAVLLGSNLSCRATFIGAQAYKKEFPDGTHYVLCLGDWHNESPREEQQLNDLLDIVQHHKKNTFVIYEGYGPNTSKENLLITPEKETILRRLTLFCHQKNIESFNAEWRPTPYTRNTPIQHTQMYLHSFDTTEREIHAYGAPKDMRTTYRACIEREKEHRKQIETLLTETTESHALEFLDFDTITALCACIGNSFIEARMAQKIYKECEKKSLIIVCAGLCHADDGSTLNTLLKNIGFIPCFKQGLSHTAEMIDEKTGLIKKGALTLPPLSWHDVGSLVISNCLCCFGPSDSLSSQIDQKKASLAALNIEQTFAQFIQQEKEQAKKETPPAPLLAQVTQQEPESTLRKR